MEKHGWSRYFTVDILDAEGPDLELEIPNGKVIRKNYVGKDIRNYDSLALLGASDGRLRRRAQAALDRRRVVLRQGVYPRRRRAG